MDDVRIVTCEACGGDGLEDVAVSDRPCRDFGGKGEVEVRVEPVTLEDLEEAHGGDRQ